ncbi:hypothetical protein C9374_008823 [Naegleria lovaniensis]|uniref:Uncharacterized protein n=1 Tax=Naegleria lovaniensis TaxID=51637 RepID=A0AA88GKD5_NAELO|nr:uncharacterized protein C9374_008823 [Naegleria lovaniensis]KAG2377738.1 hypothetical protein C9374_008823 [Naegleria lovaniensis]
MKNNFIRSPATCHPDSMSYHHQQTFSSKCSSNSSTSSILPIPSNTPKLVKSICSSTESTTKEIFSRILHQSNNHVNTLHFTPKEWSQLLFKAIQFGDENVVRALLEWGDYENQRILQQLSHSCKNAKSTLSNLPYSLESGDEQSYGATALHKACSLNRPQIVSMLLQRNDVSRCVKDHSQSTPMHYAASNGSLECVMLLLLKGENASEGNFRRNVNDDQLMLDSKDAYGNTPIHLAMKHKHYQVVSALLDYCPNLVNSRRSNSRTLLHMVVENFDVTGLSLITKEHAQALSKIQIYAKDENGLTPLMLLVKEFSRLTENSHLRKKNRFSMLLHLLSLYDLSEMSLVNRHNDHHCKNLFHIACLHNCADVVRIMALFLNRELYLNMLKQCDKNGQNPFHTACKYGADQVLETFLLMVHSETADHSKIVQSKSKHCNINSREEYLECKDKEGNTPLHVAALSLALVSPASNEEDDDSPSPRGVSFSASCSDLPSTSTVTSTRSSSNSALSFPVTFGKANSESCIAKFSKSSYSPLSMTPSDEDVTSTFVRCIEVLFPVVSLDIENSKKHTVLELLNKTIFFENSSIFSTSIQH